MDANKLNPREAKEFLGDRIVSQAVRDGVALSKIERRILYFSETHWTPPDMAAVNEEFERNYDQTEFEWKIVPVIRRARQDTAHYGNDRRSFEDAMVALRNEDHYILALIDSAGRPRPRGDPLKLILAALAIVAALVAALFFTSRR